MIVRCAFFPLLFFVTGVTLGATPASGQELDKKYEYLSRHGEEFYTQRLICAAYYGIMGRKRRDPNYERMKLFRELAAADYMNAAQRGFGGLYPKTPATPRPADIDDATQYTDHQILVLVRTLDSAPETMANFDRACDMLFQRYKFLMRP